MRLDHALERSNKAHERRMLLRVRKGKDYASEADCLANFKALAAAGRAMGIARIIETPEGVALWHELHKLQRIINVLAHAGRVHNESLRDSFDDAHNYLDLADECIADAQGEPKQEN